MLTDFYQYYTNLQRFHRMVLNFDLSHGKIILNPVLSEILFYLNGSTVPMGYR